MLPTDSNQRTPAKPFVWPPVRVEVLPELLVPPSPPAENPEPARTTPDAAPTRAAADWWREAERIWLAPTHAPLDQQIAESGWTPDSPTAYCERCGTSIGPGEAAARSLSDAEDEFGCAECRDAPPPWDRFVRLGAYTGELAEWVKQTKFTRCHWMGESLGVELGRALRRSALFPADFQSSHAVVVPVASSFWRRVHRGIDHARVVASGVAKELDVPMLAVLRRAHRPTQRGLSATAREQNVAGAFALRSSIPARARTVILVDDVRTTGATLREAARTIRRAEREVRRADRDRARATPNGAGRTKVNRSGADAPRTLQIVVAVLAVTPEASRREGLPASAADSDGPGSRTPEHRRL
ncbi:MAG: ComF family protein [Phycisphaerales bacterium]